MKPSQLLCAPLMEESIQACMGRDPFLVLSSKQLEGKCHISSFKIFIHREIEAELVGLTQDKELTVGDVFVTGGG